ncbi:hypothetical protein D6855_04080 [Butyrivibrio sp. CB08]|uniref:hypothetical protein n=1 Tax=Butyrivibrio sp. CB08 TaxID=2364879 RepID=UPI000EA8FE56|nr:hypothetical protein [Butyrivibrio sp. CB08]RKM61085.1 hypothetical protein D6855_04080 [Butyrivibrio sp. CB08]
MRKREISNKGLLSALTIGISAMMALQTPITAYANEYDEEPQDSGSGQEQSVSSGESYESVTQEAEQAADTAQEAVAPAPEAAAPSAQETSEAAVPNAQETSEAAADVIINGDEANGIEAASAEEGGKDAQAAISDLIQAAEDVVIDKESSEGEQISAATTQLKEASGSISEAKDNLQEADKANKEAESSFATVKEEAREMLDCSEAINQTANEMLEETETASQKSAQLVNSIETAATPEDAREAYADLKQLVDETKEDLAIRMSLYQRLTAEYEAALKNLETAQQALDEAEGRFATKAAAASKAADDAQDDVDTAKEKVDNLAGALEVVQDKLEDEQQANNMAGKMGTNDENAWKNAIKNINPSRETMRNVVINYYMPEILGIEVVDYKFGESMKGVDGQEYNYTELTYSYKDENGNTIEGAKKYFNWDSLTRKDYKTTNISDKQPGIVVFEKEAIEYEANQYIIQYCNKHSEHKHYLNGGERNQAYLDGFFDVYSYVDDNGETQLIIRQELIDAGCTNVGDDDQYPVFDNYKGHALTKIVQNKNSLLHDANCLIVASNNNIKKYTSKENNTDVYKWHIENKLSSAQVEKLVNNSLGLNSFIEDNANSNENAAALITKYAQYKEATSKAQEAAQNAQDQVDALNKAIDQVVEKSQRSRKTVKATTALGVSDVARYLGITVDETEAARLNDLTVAGLISELNSLKAAAKETADQANDNLEKLQQKYVDTEKVLADTLAALRKSSGGGSGSGGTGGADIDLAGAGDIGGAGAVRPATNVAAQAVAAIIESAESSLHADTVQAQDITGSQAVYDVEAAGDVGGAGVSGEAVGAGGSQTIADGDVALSETPDASEFSGDVDGIQTETIDHQTTVAIQEENVALSEEVDSGKIPEKKSFWWIMIIAIFGAAGEKMYREHMEKKRAEEVKNEE